MIIISVIVSSDFRGNQGIGNVIEIMQRRSCVTINIIQEGRHSIQRRCCVNMIIIIIIIMHMISLLSDFGVGRHQP